MDRVPLVLIPGLLCSRALYAPQCDDMRNHADIHIADHTAHATMEEIAQAILARAPRFFALGGLSMGGYIALEIMRQAPERVTALALMDTGARPDMPEQTARRRGLLELAEKGRFRGVTAQLLPLLIHPARLDDATLTRTVYAMAEDVGKDAFLRQQAAIMGRIDSRPTLPRITCRTVVICGRQDQLTPLPLAEEMAGMIPGATLEVIEDCGHLSTLERPDAVNAVLRRWIGR